MSAYGDPLRLTEAGMVECGRVRGLDLLLTAIGESIPADAVLCVETTAAAPDVVAFLEGRQIADPRAVAPNTLWPRPRTFHVPASADTIAGLRELCQHHADVEVADHLVAYREDEVLLWAHDAGDGRVMLSERLGEDAIERFRQTAATDR